MMNNQALQEVLYPCEITDSIIYGPMLKLYPLSLS